MRLIVAAAALALNVVPALAQRNVFINVGSDSGRPGELVSFDVVLDINANLVAGTENLITVDPPLTIVECGFSEDFDNAFVSEIVYTPSGCQGDPNGLCVVARGLLVNEDAMAIVGSDRLLYSCDVRIAFDAAAGTYPLPCSDASASSPAGQPYNGTGRCRESVATVCETDEDCASVGGTCRLVGETVCNDGAITVSGVPLPTHTPTVEVFSALAAAVGPTDETIPLFDGSRFGESGTIEIAGERITYRAKEGNDLVEAQRGKGGTIPVPHAGGTRVSQIASNSGGAGGGRGCAITARSAGHAGWLVVAAAMLTILRHRARREP